MINRWVGAGWVEYGRVLAGDRGFVWVVRRGLELVGLDEKSRCRDTKSEVGKSGGGSGADTEKTRGDVSKGDAVGAEL